MPGSHRHSSSVESTPIQRGNLPPAEPVRLADKLLLAAFLLAIVVPLVDGALRSPPVRAPGDPIPKPSLDWSAESLASFPRKFTSWYGDIFGLRDQLLKLHGMLCWFVFGVSPTPALVVGKTRSVELTWWNTIPVYRGVAPFSPRELEAWRALLEYRRDWLAQRGIDYLFVLAPIKSEVYPEGLPARFDRVGPPRREQLVQYMAQHSTVEIVDLTPALIEERRHDGGGEDTTYYRLGVHWNDRGILAGYQELIRRLQSRWPQMQAWTRADFDLQPAPDEGDSWAWRLYLDDLLQQRPLDLVAVRAKRSRFVPSTDVGGGRRRLEYAHEDPDLPACMVNGDSFSEPVSEFLAEHFSRTVGYRTTEVHFDAGMIERERPDVLIQLFCERQLGMQDPFKLIERAKVELGPLDDALPPQEAGARPAAPDPLAQFDASANVLFELEPSASAPLPEPFGRARIEPAGPESFAVEMQDATCGFVLPEFEFPASRTVLVEIELESPVPTALGVMFEKISAGIAGEIGVRREVQVPQGRARLVFDLVQLSERGRLIIHPGRLPGRYVVHHVEVRGLGD
jgi:hypothetical protein